MSVSFTPKMREYAKRLIRILYEEGYLGLEENAHKYVDELFFDIETNLQQNVTSLPPCIMTNTEKV